MPRNHHLGEPIAFDEAGALTPTVDFDFEQVDRCLNQEQSPRLWPGSVSGKADYVFVRRDSLILPLTSVLDWICQKVPKNNNGMDIRSAIAAWRFLPYLRGLSLTQVSAMMGRDKQSLGRWNDDFYRTWPTVAHSENNS